jgi:gamma-glutamyltranspeptidase
VDVPTSELVSQAWADAAVDRVKRVRSPVPAAVGGEGTTHVSTCDAEGNAVALTHTLASSRA